VYIQRSKAGKLGANLSYHDISCPFNFPTQCCACRDDEDFIPSISFSHSIFIYPQFHSCKYNGRKNKYCSSSLLSSLLAEPLQAISSPIEVWSRRRAIHGSFDENSKKLGDSLFVLLEVHSRANRPGTRDTCTLRKGTGLGTRGRN